MKRGLPEESSLWQPHDDGRRRGAPVQGNRRLLWAASVDGNYQIVMKLGVHEVKQAGYYLVWAGVKRMRQDQRDPPP